jgi:hypothetical protein
MSWTLSALRPLPLAFAFLLLLLPAAAQQNEPAEETAAPAADPSDAELQSFYDERLRDASPEIKDLLAKIEAQRVPNMTFRMGYTTALDRTLDQLTGAKKGPPPGVLDEQKRRADDVMARYKKLREAKKLSAPGAACDPAAKKFSWRDAKVVTPIRDQGICGSCWAFSAAASYESSYALVNGKMVDVSEQDLLDCSPEANCLGNWVQNAYDRLIDPGAATERARPYKGEQQQCKANLQRPYRAVVWAPLDADWSRVMSPEEIKENLCNFGPLAAHIYATPSFLAYTGGVYSGLEPVTHESEGYHAIVITGWDENKQAWEIKNSWGTGWGMRGFANVKYGANLLGHHLLAVLADQEALGREALDSLRQPASAPAEDAAASDAPQDGQPGDAN